VCDTLLSKKLQIGIGKVLKGNIDDTHTILIEAQVHGRWHDLKTRVNWLNAQYTFRHLRDTTPTNMYPAVEKTEK
jgi:hypothetical protein